MLTAELAEKPIAKVIPDKYVLMDVLIHEVDWKEIESIVPVEVVSEKELIVKKMEHLYQAWLIDEKLAAIKLLSK